MNKILKLALRNLTRQKRRNAVLAIAIAFGFFVVTVIDGLTSGIVDNLEDQITQLVGGTVVIQGCEYIPAENEDSKAKSVPITRDKDYVQKVVDESNVSYRYVSCYTFAAGQIIFNGKKSMIPTLYGRDFSEKELLESMQFTAGGVENLSDPNALIISDKTAKAMKLEVGDQVIFTTNTIKGQNTFADFTIAGILKSNSFMNAMQSYCHIETLNKILEMPENAFSMFSVYLKNKNEQSAAAMRFEDIIRNDGLQCTSRIEAFSTNPKDIGKGIDKQVDARKTSWEGTKYAVMTLYDRMPPVQSAMLIVHTVSFVILVVILLIVMVGVSNTYKMVLYERIREIGTMRALGMSGKDTGKIFTFEAVILCLLGAVAGLIFSIIVMNIVSLVSVKNEALLLFLKNGHFSFNISPVTVILQYILLIVLTSLAVKGSAKKAARMNPAEALRTVK